MPPEYESVKMIPIVIGTTPGREPDGKVIMAGTGKREKTASISRMD